MLRCSSERDRFFEKLNIYHYDLSLYEELLTHDNIVSAKDHDAVLLRGNCIADETNLAKYRNMGFVMFLHGLWESIISIYKRQLILV